VLDNPDIVTEQTRVKVEAATAELNSVPQERRSGTRGTTIHLIPRRSTLR
jgi:DNA-binding LacI/PurR family transcriptional regulator